MSDISDRVRTIVVEHLGVDGDKVVDGASLSMILALTVLDTVELVMAFEEEFGVEIPDDAAERILTVKDAVSFLEEKRSLKQRWTLVTGPRMSPIWWTYGGGWRIFGIGSLDREQRVRRESLLPDWAWSRRWVLALITTGNRSLPEKAALAVLPVLMLTILPARLLVRCPARMKRAG